MRLAHYPLPSVLPLVLVLAACAPAAQPTPTSPPTPTRPPAAQPTQAPAYATPVSRLVGEITVWAMGTEGEKLGVLAKDFMDRYSDVKVSVTAIPWDQAHDKILTAIAARQTPDMSLVGTTWMGEFAKTGALDPVPATFDKSQFFEGAWSTNVVGEVAYGVPWYVETRLIYYRTDIAEKAGYGQPPATWEDLKAMARAMQEKGGSKWGINLQAGGTGSWQTYLPFVWSNGGDVLGPDGKFMLNSPEAAEALAYYQSFFKEGLAPTSLPDGALVPGFVDGSIPMFISGPWFIGILKEQGGARIEGKWGLAPMPRKKTASSFVGGGNLAVFKDSKNREVAWKFAEFLTDPATQVKWYAIATDLPSVQAAWSDPTISADQRVARFGEQLKDARSAPAIPSWEEVASAIDDQVAQATRGQATAQQAADAMQQKAEEIGTGLSR